MDSLDNLCKRKSHGNEGDRRQLNIETSKCQCKMCRVLFKTKRSLVEHEGVCKVSGKRPKMRSAISEGKRINLKYALRSKHRSGNRITKGNISGINSNESDQEEIKSPMEIKLLCKKCGKGFS